MLYFHVMKLKLMMTLYCPLRQQVFRGQEKFSEYICDKTFNDAQ